MPNIVRFRPIPKETEAVLVTEFNLKAVADWVGGSISWTNRSTRVDRNGRICIKREDGYQFVPVGDWVLKEPDGRFRGITTDLLFKYFESLEEARVR